MTQILQIAGALAVLAGFVLAQLKIVDARSRLYLVLNLAGSGVLTWVALADRDWGFLLLEGVWAVVSAVSLVRVLAGRRSAPGTR
jgi:hypothetical protein